MPNIQLSTGKTIYVSAFEYYFMLKEDEIDLFFQSCIADDLGSFIEDPFVSTGMKGFLQVEDDPKIEEIPLDNNPIDIE